MQFTLSRKFATSLLMYELIFAVLFTLASAGRLENQYLPPSGAASSGGSGNFIAAPSKTSFPITNNNNQAPGNNYLPPGANSRPGGAYLPPSSLQARFGPSQSQPQGHSGGFGGNQNIGIIRLDNNNNGDGTYSYLLETENGIQQQESGQLQGEAAAAQGSYSYISPEGERITVNYIADENGFQPSGDHLPTAPPVPEAILKALEINAQQEASGIYDDGQYRPEQQHGRGGFGEGSQGPSRQYLGPVARQGSSQGGGYRY